jgi:hypothetical protein
VSAVPRQRHARQPPRSGLDSGIQPIGFRQLPELAFRDQLAPDALSCRLLYYAVTIATTLRRGTILGLTRQSVREAIRRDYSHFVCYEPSARCV